MIIDAHAHYTSAPPELQAYRGRQVMNLRNPARPRLQVSDEQLERSMRNQFKRMQDTGIDPETGHSFDDTKRYIDAVPWLTDDDRRTIFEGNARKVFSHLKLRLS